MQLSQGSVMQLMLSFYASVLVYCDATDGPYIYHTMHNKQWLQSLCHSKYCDYISLRYIVDLFAVRNMHTIVCCSHADKKKKRTDKNNETHYQWTTTQ